MEDTPDIPRILEELTAIRDRLREVEATLGRMKAAAARLDAEQAAAWGEMFKD